MNSEICYIPKIEEQKELRFLYAVNRSQSARPLETDPSVFLGTNPVNIMIDLEVDRNGKDSSDYMIEFNDILSNNFLEDLKQFGYEINFISISKYNDDNLFSVWFKEVQKND